MEEVLGGVGARVAAEQDRGLAGVDLERLGARGVLAARGVEALDRRAVVGAVDPAVGDAELERSELGLGLDQVQRAEQLVGVDAVAGRRDGGGAHVGTSWVQVGIGSGEKRGLTASRQMLCAPYLALVRRARSLRKRYAGLCWTTAIWKPALSTSAT